VKRPAYDLPVQTLENADNIVEMPSLLTDDSAMLLATFSKA